jgi:glyoxylase-like metal-dependent hydrolase (beta-lactamase superfamily II)
VSPLLKRVLIGVGALVGLLACAAGYVFHSAFANNRPIVDRQVLVPGVEIVKDSFVSVAVLDAGPNQVVLVDAGNDKDGKALLAALADRQLSPAAVTAIFLTHGHPDHTAGCHLFPAAKVYAMEADVKLVGSAAAAVLPLKDGDVIDVGGTRVEAFATPGHTPGSAVYLARGVLFFGDSAGGSKDGDVMPAVRFFSKDSDQNVASLKGLAMRLQPRAGEVKVLAFAHSGPLDGLAPLVTFANNH